MDKKVQWVWQESLFMPKLMKSVVAFSGISFLLSFQTRLCNSKREVYFLSTLFFSAKNLMAKLSIPVLLCTLPSSSNSSSHIPLFSLLPRKLTQCSPLWNWNSWSCLKKVYKSKSTWTAHMSWWGKCKAGENLFYYVLILSYISQTVLECRRPVTISEFVTCSWTYEAKCCMDSALKERKILHPFPIIMHLSLT